MPNILPGARWEPVDVGNRARRRKGRGAVGHVAVSGSANLRPGPLSTRPSDWHFYLPKSGPAIQQIDMDLQSWSSGDANADCVNWESQGGLGDSRAVNTEPLTDNQVYWAARILRHLHDTEGVPLRAMTSSHASERGQGWHRLGIKHSRGLGAVPGWRRPGDQSWSTKVGKECPGDRKIAQISTDVVRLAATLDQGDSPTPVQEDDDMRIIVAPNRPAALVGPGFFRPLNEEEAANAPVIYGQPVSGNDRQWDLWRLMALTGDFGVLDAPIERNEKAGGGTTTLRAQTHWADYNHRTVTPEAVAKVVGTPDVDALAVKLGEALQGKTSITGEDVEAALRRVLREGTGDPAPGPVA